MRLHLGMRLHVALDPRARFRIERARDVPRQQRLDLVALAEILQSLVSHHGHPRSMPRASKSSDSFFLA